METPELFESQYSLNSDKNSLLSNLDSLTGSNPLSPLLTDKSHSPIGSGDNWMLQQATNWFDPDPLTLPTSPSPLFSSSSSQFTSFSANSTADPILGNNSNQLLVGANPDFTIKTAGTFTMNGSGDLDGDALNPNDDALVYAAFGYTINGNPILPVQRDAQGNVIKDSTGKPILVDNAITVAPGYTVSNGPSNKYAGLNPPTVIANETFEIPAYNTIKTDTLANRIPTGTPETIFDASRNPLNNLKDWQTKFPSTGTPNQPKLIRVINGGLNVPHDADLSNSIIIVDRGDINFNGSNHDFTNSVLIANNGNINLDKVNANNLAILASGSININGGAIFSGNQNLIATDNGNITFNGSTKTANSSDQVQVIAKGNITFNGSSSTRGSFESTGTFTFNGSSYLYGSIEALGNIIFNGNATVIGASISNTLNQTPTNLLLNPTSVVENVPINTIVGNFSTVDPNSNDVHSYQLVTGLGDTDNNAFQIVNNQLQIKLSPDFETKDSYSIRVRTTDRGGLSLEKNLFVQITNVNEAPIGVNLTQNTIAENSTTGTVVGQLSSLDPDRFDSHTYSLVDDALGRFKLVGNQLQVANSSLLDFEPATSHLIKIKTTDAGGLSFIQQIAINLVNVNEAPINLTLSSHIIAENQPIATVVGTLATADPDLGDLHSYQLVTGTGDTDNNAFQIVNNQLQIKLSPDFESKDSYSIRVRTTDKGGLSLEKNLFVQITNVNEVPIDIALSQSTIAENTPITTAIAQLSTLDPDLGDSHTYQLVAGTGDLDNTAFTIAGDRLYLQQPADFETQNSYTLRVRTTDLGGLFAEKILTIGISDVNEAPTSLRLSQNTIVENSPIDSIIGTFTSQDPDPEDSHTYSLISGTGDSDNSAFEIVDNKLQLKVSPDFETKSVYHLRVKTTDRGGLSWEKQLTVDILDLIENHAPTAIWLSNSSVAENSAKDTLIARLTSTDLDPTDTHTYTLLDDAGSRFKIVGSELRVANGSLLDFETADQHQIRVRTTDSANPSFSYEQTLTIAVTNVNEAPQFNSTPLLDASSGQSYSYLITTQDPDVGDTRIISANEPLPSWLQLTDNGDGTATLSGRPAPTDLGNYQISLAVIDAGGIKTLQNFQIKVVTTLIEETSFSKRLDLPVTVPNNGGQLSFKLVDVKFDLNDTQGINDALEIALVDASGKSLVAPFQAGREAFFNWTEGEGAILGRGTTYNPNTGTVTLDLTGIVPGAAKLVFRLVNDDLDTTTSVKLAEVTVTPDAVTPATPSNPLPGLPTSPSPVPPAFFNSTTDVSSSIKTEYHRTSFNSQTQELWANLALKNQGSYGIDQTVVVIVKNITDPSVTLKNADGFTPEGLPYYTFTAADGNLDPGRVTQERILVFRNPNGVQFSYEVSVLAETNVAPTIKSQPVISLTNGRDYRYQVRAEDLNGDTLTYKLASAPDGMKIDERTGLITWDASSSGVGNYYLSVEVSDGRGGVASQDFNLGIIAQPPNRPPIFTSTPVVDAVINREYEDLATAVDPDGDVPLSYALVTAPPGMTIDPITGKIKWKPSPTVVLGDTVLSRIRTPGEINQFSFSGTKGQRIYVDPLQYSGDVGQWRWDLYSPTGKKLVDGANFNWNSNALLTLVEDGNYQLSVRTNGDKTGNYGFRLIDTALTPQLPFDDRIETQLAPGTQDKLFRFTGNQGQKLYFDQIAKTGDLDWTIYDAANRAIASNYYADDMEIDLPASGDYILAVRGRSGFTSTSQLEFAVVTPELTTQVMPLNTVISGAIAERGERDTYTFTGTAGQQLFYDALGGDYFTLKILDPTGREIASGDSRSDRGPDNGITLGISGTYRVIIDGNGGDLGNYRFQILDKAAATTFALDTDIIGTLNAQNGTASYRFNIDKDDTYVYFNSQGGGYPNYRLLYDGSGKLVTQSYIYDDQEFSLKAGDYWLVMRGRDATDTSYKLRLVTPEFKTTAINVGETISGSITETGEQDTFTFTGTSGQQLFYDALSTSNFAALRIYDPTGTEIRTYSGRVNQDQGPDYLRLTLNGTYKVVIDGDGDAIGDYKFRLLDKADSNTITSGVEISDSIESIGSKLYRFSAQAGEHFYLNTTDGQHPNAWIIYDPNGQFVQYGHIQDNYYRDEWEFDAAKSGEYTLVIQGNGAANPNYKFTLTNSPLPTRELILGSTVTSAIGQQGEKDTYTFDGAAGQRLHLDILNRGGYYTNVARIYDPTGKEIYGRNFYDQDYQDFLTLKQSGKYKIVIDGYGANTDSYSFRLLDVKQANIIAKDTDISGQLAAGQETVLYQFSGNKGERLYLDWLSNSPNTQWSLYDSGSQPLSNGWVGDYETVLANDDTYTIAVRGYHNAPVDYQFRLVTPDNNTLSLNLGTNNNSHIVTGKIDEKGEVDTYTFSGVAGQKIYLDVINTGNNYIKITDPTGRQLLNRGLWDGDSNPILLTATGNYKVEIDGNGESTDNYQFSLLDLSQAANLSFDTQITGTLSNGKDSQFYQFVGTAGQRLNFDSLINTSNTSWTLYDANGLVLINNSANTDREITLSSSGSYLLGVRGNNNTPVNYKFQVSQLSPAISAVLTGTPLALNTPISGSITANTPDRAQYYTFSGTAGQKLFYDANNSDYFRVWIQDPAGKPVYPDAYYNGRGFDGRYDIGPETGLTLTMDGTYRITVHTEGGVGNYNFQLLDLSSASQIAFDTDVQGTLTPNASASKAYSFNLTSRQHLFLDAQQGDGAWIIYQPNGQYLTSARLYEDRDLWLDAGEYSLVVQGYNSSPNYKFKLSNLSSAPVVNLDTDIQGNLSSPATNIQSYRFNVSDRQYLYFDAQQGDGAYLVYKPNGELLTQYCSVKEKEGVRSREKSSRMYYEN